MTWQGSSRRLIPSTTEWVDAIESGAGSIQRFAHHQALAH